MHLNRKLTNLRFMRRTGGVAQRWHSDRRSLLTSWAGFLVTTLSTNDGLRSLYPHLVTIHPGGPSRLLLLTLLFVPPSLLIIPVGVGLPVGWALRYTHKKILDKSSYTIVIFLGGPSLFLLLTMNRKNCTPLQKTKNCPGVQHHPPTKNVGMASESK